MRRLIVLVLALLLAFAMLSPAYAGNKNAPHDLTWDAFGITFHGYFQVNPNGLMHQWRADDDGANPGWHYTYQPVGSKWPAADCKTEVYDNTTATWIPNPKFAGSSLYSYPGSVSAWPAAKAVLDTIFDDGTDYWVCSYMP